MPVGAVPGHPRHLIARNDADLVQADIGNQPLKAITTDGVSGGPPLVFVDDHDLVLGPAQFEETLAECSLIEAALAVLLNVPRIGLPDVQDRQPAQMSRANLRGTVHSPPPR